MLPGAMDGVASSSPSRSSGPALAVFPLGLTVAPVAPVIFSPLDTAESKLTVASLNESLNAETVQVVLLDCGIDVGLQDWVSFTSPCLLRNATGRWTDGCEEFRETNVIFPKYCAGGAFDVMVTSNVRLSPARMRPCFGVTLIVAPAGASV